MQAQLTTGWTLTRIATSVFFLLYALQALMVVPVDLLYITAGVAFIAWVAAL